MVLTVTQGDHDCCTIDHICDWVGHSNTTLLLFSILHDVPVSIFMTFLCRPATAASVSCVDAVNRHWSGSCKARQPPCPPHELNQIMEVPGTSSGRVTVSSAGSTLSTNASEPDSARS
jgi:hypothetical protein